MLSLFAKFMENITGNVTNLWHVTKHIFAPNQDHPTYPPSRWCVFFFWRLPQPGNGIAITTSTNVTETFDYIDIHLFPKPSLKDFSIFLHRQHFVWGLIGGWWWRFIRKLRCWKVLRKSLSFLQISSVTFCSQQQSRVNRELVL